MCLACRLSFLILFSLYWNNDKSRVVCSERTVVFLFILFDWGGGGGGVWYMHRAGNNKGGVIMMY